ncbi:hypothetical protein D0Z07_0449 [Hyphodiscus hymeniophilus]|uniref:CsbD-like domain-containing protein n=1 Tax=Hyphodiscus hymeniophilus TaxID=353542 RepID=A0A9P6VQZ8_9HELO|nr:hypothetical protein D0Z07_0449 [Hyphodiscus hymeniophilus]
MSSEDSNSASMLNGHVQYAKGYAQEVIGNATGSQEWQESGKSATQAGIDEMKTANQQKISEPAASGFGGRVEELAGKAAGCEGMEAEGKERQEKV